MTPPPRIAHRTRVSGLTAGTIGCLVAVLTLGACAADPQAGAAADLEAYTGVLAGVDEDFAPEAAASDPALASSGGTGAAAVPAAPSDPDPADTDAGEPAPTSLDMSFAVLMIGHHEQAVAMSRTLLAADGIDPELRKLADFIVVDQTRELTAMQDWLDAWHTALDDPAMDHDMAAMAGNGSMPMSGMATPEQLAELAAATGDDAAHRFVELMIAHHEGAIEMARTQIIGGSNVYLIGIAKHIAAEQQLEIDAMRNRFAS